MGRTDNAIINSNSIETEEALTISIDDMSEKEWGTDLAAGQIITTSFCCRTKSEMDDICKMLESPSVLEPYRLKEMNFSRYPTLKKVIEKNYKLAFPLILLCRNLVLESKFIYSASQSKNDLIINRSIYKDSMLKSYIGEEAFALLDKKSSLDFCFMPGSTLFDSIDGSTLVAMNSEHEYLLIKTIPLPNEKIWANCALQYLNSFRAINHPNLLKILDIWGDYYEFKNLIGGYVLSFSLELPDNASGKVFKQNENYEILSLKRIISCVNRISPYEIIAIISPILSLLAQCHKNNLFFVNIDLSTIIFHNQIPKVCPGFIYSPGYDITFWPSAYHELFNSSQDMTFEIGCAIDLYSVGMVAYCCFTGLSSKSFPQVPFELLETTEGKQLNAVILKACSLQFKQAEEFLDVLYYE